MGTLFKQSTRWDNSFSGDRIAELAKALSKSRNITFSEALECIKLEVTLLDYDAKDEQLAGFGELLKELNSTLSVIANSLEDR